LHVLPFRTPAEAPRTARFAARANAIAAFHGPRAAASARAASRSASRPRSAGSRAKPVRPAPVSLAGEPKPALAPGAWPGGAWPGGRPLHGSVVACRANATCDRCIGALSSGGFCPSRAAISGGKYARSRTAAHVSRIRADSVRTYRCCARCAAPAIPHIPCVVFAAIIRAMPSGVRGPVLRPPCILHRPFGIAGPRHGAPERAFAPQRAGGSGGGLAPEPAAAEAGESARVAAHRR
jgi:hypothetical protein